MRDISINKLYDNFYATIEEFGTYLLNCGDEQIGYYVFEEFESDSISFLHCKTLKKLLRAKYINLKIFYLCIKLHREFWKLESTPLWNADSVKADKKWLKLLQLSDKIKKLLINRNGPQHKKASYSYFQGVFQLVFMYCGNHVLALSDEELEGVIYEEYMFCYVDLYEYNRTAFKRTGYISDKIAQKMKRIADLSDEAFSEKMEFSANFVRTSPIWKRIFDLADELRGDFLLPISKHEYDGTKFDFVVGEAQTLTVRHYSARVLFNNKEYTIGVVNEFIGLEPQFERLDNLVVIGHNNKVSLIDLATEDVSEFDIFPVFYQFFIYQQKIIVVGELQALCISNNTVIWEESFDEYIDVESFEEGKLTIRKNSGKLFTIDTNKL